MVPEMFVLKVPKDNDTDKGSSNIAHEANVFERLYEQLNASGEFDWMSEAFPFPRLFAVVRTKTMSTTTRSNTAATTTPTKTTKPMTMTTRDREIYDIGGKPRGLVLEYVGKQTLHLYLDGFPKLQWQREYCLTAIDILQQVTSACLLLQSTLSVAHCDLHSKNVMVIPTNASVPWKTRVVLLDLQMAVCNGSSVTINSNNLPPEDVVNDKTDVYGIGLLISVFFFNGKTIYATQPHRERGWSARHVLESIDRTGNFAPDAPADAHYHYPLQSDVNIWRELVAIMRGCLSAAVEKRMSLAAVRDRLAGLMDMANGGGA
jgi:hypothetical protein